MIRLLRGTSARVVEPSLVHFCILFLRCGACSSSNSLQGMRRESFAPSCISNLLLTSVAAGGLLTAVRGVDGVTLGRRWRWAPRAFDAPLRGFIPAVITYLEATNSAKVSRAITTVPAGTVHGVGLDRGRGASSAVHCGGCGLELKSGHRGPKTCELRSIAR